MFLESFKATTLGFTQSLILAAVGFFIYRRKILGEEGLNALSQLILQVTLPLMIFGRLIKNFNFVNYPDWWLLPFFSIMVTALGLAVGMLFIGAFRDKEDRFQFLSLVAFQNSGYLPMSLIASLLPANEADVLFIYLFLFLLGFNLLLFSLGVYFLTFSKDKKFDWLSLLNPPVISTVISILIVFFKLNKFIPDLILRPIQMAGDCTLPLAVFVVGANIAAIRLEKINIKAMSLLVFAKLILLPALGLFLVFSFDLPQLMGFVILIQLAMPPAMNLSVIVSQYKKEDRLISQGIFFGHVMGLLTIPVFLSLYFIINMLK